MKQPRDLFADGFTADDFDFSEGYSEECVADQATKLLREALEQAQDFKGNLVDGFFCLDFRQPDFTHTAKIVAIKAINQKEDDV